MRMAQFALVVGCVAGFTPAPVAPLAPALRTTRTPPRIVMKKWEKRKTLAETAGGIEDHGSSAVGLVGNIPVTFTQGNQTLNTMAIPGQPLSEVAAQCGQFIKYKCRKGECGTCEVRVDGQWTRTCVTKVPHVAPGETFAVHVRGSMKKTAKASRFYSFKSIIAGARNNLLGMVGFVRDSRKSKSAFTDRLDAEEELIQAAKVRKAARLAADKTKKR